MPVRKSEAVWNGDLVHGNGTVQVAGQQVKYSFSSRFENGAGSNPEELIGAAHAGCFSMAFAAGMGKAGFKPERVATTAEVSIEKVGEGFKITKIVLRCSAKVPGIDQAKFKELAEGAKKGCPVSQALSAVPIELEAKLA